MDRLNKYWLPMSINFFDFQELWILAYDHREAWKNIAWITTVSLKLQNLLTLL